MKEMLLTPVAKVTTDIALIVLLLTCYITGETTDFEANWSIWFSTHAAVGFLMCMAMGIHLWQHWKMIKAFKKRKVIFRNIITFLCVVFFCLLAVSILIMLCPAHQTLEIHNAISTLFTILMIIHTIVKFPSMMRLIRRTTKATETVCEAKS